MHFPERVTTVSICIGCNKHFVQFVLLHQATDFFDGTLEARYVLSVAPDEVLPPEVDSQIWTTFS